MRPGLPLAGLWLAAPVLLVQGRRVRRTTPRLPAAAGFTGVVGRGEDVMRLVVLGDSVAAGVGVDHHDRTIAGCLAGRLSASARRPVAWTVLALGGDAADGVLARARASADVLSGAEVVVVSVGVNDTKGLRSDRRWRAELTGLLDTVLALAPRAQVVLLGLPPLQAFPALPRLLAALLGQRARRLDEIGRDVAAGRPRVRRLELELGESPGLFAEDGFHPSPLLHDMMAERIGALLE